MYAETKIKITFNYKLRELGLRERERGRRNAVERGIEIAIENDLNVCLFISA